jgi:hypothetical protein
MLVAPKKPRGPAWEKVMGAEVEFAPITQSMLRRARRAALKRLGREEEAESEADAAEQLEDLGDALSEALIMEGVRNWRDVAQQVFDGDDQPVLGPDGNTLFEILTFSAENLAIVLSDPLVFEAFDAAYVVPFAQRERVRTAQGKDLPPSRDGTSSVGMPAQTIAGSPAATARAADAKRAPMKSKPRKPTRKRAAGKS